MKKIINACLLSFLLVFGLCGCSSNESRTATTKTVEKTSSKNTVVSYDEDDLDEDYSDEDAQSITLTSNKISYEGTGATIKGTTITLTKAGTYIFSGTIQDANIVVDTDKKALVRIVLKNAHITSTTTAPIYIKQADKVLLTLAKGSKNTLKDTASYSNVVDNEPNAAIFSKDDLSINGSGALTIEAQFHNGIQSKDDLKIVNGTLTITAQNHGLVGKDVLAMRNGTVNINAQGDGMKATNIEDTTKGIVCIEDGTLHITAQEDGIQSDNLLYVYGGEINIVSGGGSSNGTQLRNEQGFNPFEQNESNTTSDNTISMKGIKSQNDMEISGGTITINSADDALHSNGSITIKDGTFHIQSGDDGIHADQTLTIQKGNITIESSYEGVEGSEINIQGGSLHILASDDGINASSTSTALLNITGGYVYVESDGDGIDSNGNISMQDGTVIVNGTQSGGNGSIDYDGTFDISGGTLITSGSNEMLQYPSSVSNGNLAIIAFNASQSEMIHIQDSENNAIVTYQPTRSYQVFTIYSSKLVNGTTYQILTGGSAQNATDGVYDSTTYTGGSTYDEFTISSTTSSVGTIGGMGGNNGGGPNFR